MTDMLIDGIITKDEYENKLAAIMRKLHNLELDEFILFRFGFDYFNDIAKF